MKDLQDRRKIITGRAGEAMAADFLKQQGYRILEMNYRCSIGEIDMVAREKGDLVFVEVKTRKSGAMGYPEQAVGLAKQKKMSQLALWYLRDKNIGDVAVRFDVVAIVLLSSGSDIRLIRGAFDFIALE